MIGAMSELLASRLAGDEVMTTDGVEIGTLARITMDVSTGRLESLHVDPNPGQGEGFERDDDGLLAVPAGRIETRGDYLLVER